MLVAYKEGGQYSAAVPVVWERPAGFSKELASKLRDYENLAAHVFKVTRIGTGKDTKYSLDYVPVYDKPDLVPADFSAFNNFDITKHSFWVKTADELAAFIANGSFPAAEPKPASTSTNLDKIISSPAEEKAVEQALGMTPEATPVPAVQPAPVAEEPKPTTERPARNFSGFSF
jgi:hypothetical protein